MKNIAAPESIAHETHLPSTTDPMSLDDMTAWLHRRRAVVQFDPFGVRVSVRTGGDGYVAVEYATDLRKAVRTLRERIG